MYRAVTQNGQVRVVCSADLENVDMACAEIRKILVQQRLTEHMFSVELLVREAANNAVLHGSGADPQRVIEVRFEVNDGSIVIEVTDEGPGFGWQALMAGPTDSTEVSGRGLTIMRAYAHEVAFNPKGNSLRLGMRLRGRRD